MQLIPVTATTIISEDRPAIEATLDAVRADEAETALVGALAHLDHLRLVALTGGKYDPDEYDAAVMSYRRARAAAEEAQAGWARAQRAAWHYVA